MKGYWVNHVIEIKDCEKFFAYASAEMLNILGEKLMFGSATATSGGRSKEKFLSSVAMSRT